MEQHNLALPEYINMVYENMESLNYKKSTLKVFKQGCKKLMTYAISNKMSLFSLELKDDFLSEHFNYPPNQKNLLSQSQRNTILAMQKLTDFYLNGSVSRIKASQDYVFDECFSEAVKHFQHLLSSDKYSTGTVYRINTCLQRFCDYLKGKGIDDFKKISKTDISSYTKTLFGLAPKTIALELYRLRKFCQFLYLEGYHKENLVESVTKFSYKRNLKLPQIWEKDDISKILSSIDRGNPCGKRDYAILLLVTRLGLRNSDVSNLSFHNLNWEKSLIEFTQQKTSEKVILPLHEDVGLAIIDYLKYGRPESDLQNIFISHNAPCNKVISFNHVLSKYLYISGVKFSNDKAHGMHSLRHTLASRLLEEKVPVGVIANILGHTDINSAKTYLRMYIESLRQCALNPEEVFNDETL